MGISIIHLIDIFWSFAFFVIPAERNASDDGVLTRSVASIYLEQGRNRTPAVDVDTIYTPEGTFIGNQFPIRVILIFLLSSVVADF